MQAHGNIIHVLTVNTAGQVGPNTPSTVRLLQILQNATNSHKNPINAIAMTKNARKCYTEMILAPSLTKLNTI